MCPRQLSHAFYLLKEMPCWLNWQSQEGPEGPGLASAGCPRAPMKLGANPPAPLHCSFPCTYDDARHSAQGGIPDEVQPKPQQCRRKLCRGARGAHGGPHPDVLCTACLLAAASLPGRQSPACQGESSARLNTTKLRFNAMQYYSRKSVQMRLQLTKVPRK